jgi:polar amino acid transport system permease protein
MPETTSGDKGDSVTQTQPDLRAVSGRIASIPSLETVSWWIILLLIALITATYLMLASETYQRALGFIANGVWITLWVSVAAFVVALLIGLITGLGRVSKNPIFFNLSTLYVEVIRGIPLIVQIIYIAFVATPLAIGGVNLFMPSISRLTASIGIALPEAIETSQVGFAVRGMIGLAFGYGAYLAEVFRAGIESIPRGQMEASRSLGMSYPQAMRYVILPQAIRVILPPLGNDFIAMLKDSALISVVSARDITYSGRLFISRTFDTYTGWNTVVYLYLLLTLSLSLVVRLLERRASFEK